MSRSSETDPQNFSKNERADKMGFASIIIQLVVVAFVAGMIGMAPILNYWIKMLIIGLLIFVAAMITLNAFGVHTGPFHAVHW